MLAVVAFVILSSRVTATRSLCHFFDVLDQPKPRVTRTGPHLRNAAASPVRPKGRV
jgi:hypothetical protein